MTDCIKTTAKGKPCKSAPMHGRDVCKAHSRDPDIGQPLKLTDKTHETIVRALASGCYRETAALHAGIGTSTFYRWLEQGEADDEHGVDSPFRALWEAIKKAEADAEVQATALIRAAAPKNWQAAAWLLERKYPKRWGRQERVEHVGDGRHAPVMLPNDEERLAQIAELLLHTGALEKTTDGDSEATNDSNGTGSNGHR